MFAGWKYRSLTAQRNEGIRPRLSHTLKAAGRVTVLLLVMTVPRAAFGEDTNATDFHMYQFVSQFYTPMAPARLEGLMVSDGMRCRIAFYWMEPYVLRESDLFVRYADLILMPEGMHYWAYGAPRGGTYDLTDEPNGSLLPRTRSPESVVRSALPIVSRIGGPANLPGVSLEVGRFFRAGRNQTNLTHVAATDEADGSNPWNAETPDVQILNTLPFGREYSREQRDNGAVVWKMAKALPREPLATVTIRLLGNIDREYHRDTFDVTTLGRWELIPDAYRAYWSFHRACKALTTSPGEHAARELYDKINCYLDDKETPDQVHRGLDRLRFKVALATGESERIWTAAAAAVMGLCSDDSVNPYQRLLELGSMSGRIDKQCPEGAEERLRPLVARTVQRTGADIERELDRLMAAIDRNSWFTYGSLLLDEIRHRALLCDRVVDPLAAKLAALRLARERRPFDPCEVIPSVRKYLAMIDADPPRGAIDMSDAQGILDNGLAKCYPEDQSEAKRAVVESVIRSLRLIVGEGPFCGDPAELTEAVERFSYLYFNVDKAVEPIDTVLATFIALSFCDISTPQDHDVLCSQFHELSMALHSRLCVMLRERGLTSLVSAEDAEEVLAVYERIMRRYVADPMCPQLKFPLTASEQIGLANTLNVRVFGLRPLFDEISLRLRYGGPSTGLRERLMREIASAAEELLPRAVFLRNPSYRGISCRYRSPYGFVTVIRGPLYREGDRPRDTFKAMKYFHLGHRLEEVVMRERELARSAAPFLVAPPTH